MSEPKPEGKLKLVVSSIGELVVELWPKECPKACRNFVQLCLEGYYDGTVFHRLLPGFLVQGGDPTGTGMGGESIYDEVTFEDEISQRLRFNRRGLLAMANTGRNTNASQFFFTLDRADNLYGHNTLFGCITGDTLFNLLKFNELELDESHERPLYPPTIRSVEVLENPFTDIVPRITAKERKEQAEARKETKKARSKEQQRGKAIKNAALLSFGAEAEDPEQPVPSQKGMKSAHDILVDASLSKESDDRGISAQLPANFLSMPSSSKNAPEGRPQTSKKPKESFEYVKTETALAQSEQDKLKEQIASVSASLKAMKQKKRPSPSVDDAPAAKKAKQEDAGIDGAALLTAQRETYLKSGKATRKADTVNDEVIATLDSFRSEMRQARKAADQETKLQPLAEAPIAGYSGEVLEEEEYSDDNDMSFMTHKLKFRKDVTAERAQRDDYITIDPRESNMTLEDAKKEEDRRKRKGLGPSIPSKERSEPYRERGGVRARGYDKGSGQDRDWRGQARE